VVNLYTQYKKTDGKAGVRFLKNYTA